MCSFDLTIWGKVFLAAVAIIFLALETFIIIRAIKKKAWLSSILLGILVLAIGYFAVFLLNKYHSPIFWQEVCWNDVIRFSPL